MGTLRVQSGEKGAKRGTALATIFGQWASSGNGFVHAIGAGCLEWVEIASFVSGTRHHRVVGALLYDSPIRGVLWSSCAFDVASARTWQCDGGIW